MNAFPDKLKALRGNMKQAEFARKIGIAQNSYNRYESGERVPDITVLSQLASRLRVSTDWLLGLADDSNTTPAAPSTPRVAELSTVEYSSCTACNQKDQTIANQAESIVNLSRSLAEIVNARRTGAHSKAPRKS